MNFSKKNQPTISTTSFCYWSPLSSHVFTIQDHQPAFRRALRAEALVVGQGALHIFQRFQVLRIGVVRGFQVDSVLQIPGFLNMGTDGMEVFFWYVFIFK